MENSDTVGIKNQKKMDANKVWQWRISHVKKYSGCPEPFHYCRKMGLEFNVGSKVPKKLDLLSVTNGVILEICDFAKMINMTKRHFITNILENNFDLGLENEHQRIEFTAQILHKVKDLIRKPPKDKHDVFSLFDTSSKPECISNSKNGLNMASTKDKTDSFLVEMDDIDDSEHEDEWYSQTPSKEFLNREEMDGPHADDSDHEEVNLDVLLLSFPYCEEIGLSLDIGSKQNLDPGLLTKGVMLELIHFTRVLTSYDAIVLGVLEHNFELDVKSQQGKKQVWFKISQLLKRREELITMFKNEPFSFQIKRFKRRSAQSSLGDNLYQFEDMTKRRHSEKRALSTTNKGATKKCKREQSEQEAINTVSHHNDLCTSQIAEVDQSYMCPLDSDEISDSENTENQNHLQNPTSSDIPRESESSNLPTVNSDVNPLFASQPDKRELCGNDKQTQRNAPNVSLMEQEEMETESNMWKFRANRVKQILFLLDKEYCGFHRSKAFGLEFNVGFGPKQNISVNSLSDAVLLEVAKFALAMNSSQQDFIMEILKYNFDFGMQSENHRKAFASEIMNKVRQLKSSEDAVKFSREVFELPGTMSSFNTAKQSMSSVSSELSSISRMEECDVPPVCPPDSHAEAKERSTDLYPFCKDIGLKLHVNYGQPNKKLEISKLTNGAMTEVTNFAEKLCGTFEQICLDILRHNFDVDLQSEDSDLAKKILARIPVITEQKNVSTCLTSYSGLKHTLTVRGKWNFPNDPNLEACSSGCSQASIIDQKVGSSTDTEHEDELNLGLWKLRANQIQQILSVPHEEHCPLYSYSRCKKIGIDFNVGSGVKQNLDPKLLTHGVMVEINTFAAALQSAAMDFITEILEYNFHLDLKNETYRTVFGQQILGKIRATTSRKKPSLMKKPFELPDSKCIEKSAYPKLKYCPKCFQDRNDKLCHDESDPGHMLHPRPHAKTDTIASEANCTAQGPAKDPSPASPTTEDAIMDNYPHCRKTGLSLCVDKNQPNIKLDTPVLTRGIMNEVAHFANKLCGKKYNIVNDVLKHNFNFGMQSQDINPAAQFSRIVALYNKEPTWFSEIFVVQPYSQSGPGDVSKPKDVSAMQTRERKATTEKRKQEKRAFSTESDCVTKRLRRGRSEEEEINTVSHHTDIGGAAEIDQSYMCPLYSDSENTENQDHLQNPTSSDIPRESESSSLGMIHNHSSSLPTVNSDVNPLFASQPHKRELCGNDKQTRSNAPSVSLMEQEELETESNMWKFRANRVKQILLQDKEYCGFHRSKAIGLEFNVGFGPKQNISVDSLTTSVPLEVAKFALAMNSSQQDFIMEILEYNFDFGLQSENHRKAFASEIMNKVRQLKNSEDAVKFSREVFELPGTMSSFNTAKQSMSSVSSELSSTSKMEECDVPPVCPPDSHAEVKEHSVDLYPFCKEIGLKLHVNCSQPNKKLEISKLTNGAMTEVMNFAEKLCGTFEQICLDILRHNFVDLQSGDSDLAKNILAQIPVITEQKNLSICLSASKKVRYRLLVRGKWNFPNDPNLEACSSGCSQASIIDQKVGSSTDTEHEDELNLEDELWKLRANQIQQILSVPHGEHCPLYSYSKCKRIGIDFNVGSGVKQNLDPKLLTNGVMVEISIFAAALQSASKDFVTEILEYNFHLDLKNDLYRTLFAQQILKKMRRAHLKKQTKNLMKKPFELPDSKCIEESTYPKLKYCPKCFQDRNDKLCHDDSGHMLHPRLHGKTDTIAGEANCTAQGPAKDTSTACLTTEEAIMGNYPHCKKIGLNLCVDEDQPKTKLDTRVLTHGIMNEVAHFAKKLCGQKYNIINDVLKHNFNFGMQSQDINPAAQFNRIVAQNNKEPTWFSEIFAVEPCSQRESGDVSKPKDVSAMQTRESRETTKKCKQEKRAFSRKSERVTKRLRRGQSEEEEINTVSHHTDIGGAAEIDQSYMCPLDSDEISDSENTENQDYLHNPASSYHMPFLTTTDDSSNLPMANSNVYSPFASLPDKIELCGDEEQTQIARNVPNECFMKQEDVETESNMWKMRTKRVKQILFKEYCGYHRSRAIGLEFTVGFGPKQNISVDSLTNSVLLEVAKFALAMNSSQQDFIMEILEYNFDFGLQSENHRKAFASEIMNKVRQLKNSEDAVKFSREVFELPGTMSSFNTAKQSMSSVSSELSSVSKMEECDVPPVCPPDSHAEVKEHSVDLYPFCKEIGLKLHVNCSQPHKTLEISKLTNGAMTEVMNFAEKLCGTFEQICLDILRHNFVDLQSGDSDLAKNILAQIPVITEQKNLSTCLSASKKVKHTLTVRGKWNFPNDPNLEACSSGCSQTPIIDQKVESSTDTEQEDELNLGLWKLRANQIQQILSVPHEEHCPLYSYSRCKKVGIDFNVGSGVKQNLDPKLLTNGIMVEVSTFTTALQSATKDFITEILECNFHLDLKNELYRTAFAQQILDKIRATTLKKKNSTMKLPFELPDSSCIESACQKIKYCPRCYEVRGFKLCQDGYDPGHILRHPHSAIDTVSSEANCTPQKPAKDLSSASPATDEAIMDNYPHCKKTSLNLCVDKDQPRDKLDSHVLTRGIMKEVAHFAKKLCGTKFKIINDVLKHNFNFGMQSQYIHPAAQFNRVLALYNKEPTWFSEVFVVQPYSRRDPGDVSKPKDASAMQTRERKEIIKKRQLALQTKKERVVLPSDSVSVGKPKKHKESSGGCYPICAEIGLDLDVTSKSEDKEKLDLKLLTIDVVLEIYKFVVKNKLRQYLPGAVYDILDYNFDLSSQYDRHWEFALAVASKVKNVVKNHRTNRNQEDKIFKLPFLIKHKSLKTLVQKRQKKKHCTSFLKGPHKTTKESTFVQPVRHLSDINEKEPWCDDDTESLTDPGTIMQMNGTPVSTDFDSLQENIQIKEEEYDPHYGDVKPELQNEIKYPHCQDVKNESNTDYVKYLVPGEPARSLGHTFFTVSNIRQCSETEAAQYSVLTEPQVSEQYAILTVCPNTGSRMRTDTEGVEYLVPVETAGIQGYAVVNICNNTESTLIKEEQENVPAESHAYGVSKGEVDIKQE